MSRTTMINSAIAVTRYKTCGQRSILRLGPSSVLVPGRRSMQACIMGRHIQTRPATVFNAC